MSSTDERFHSLSQRAVNLFGLAGIGNHLTRQVDLDGRVDRYGDDASFDQLRDRVSVQVSSFVFVISRASVRKPRCNTFEFEVR